MHFKTIIAVRGNAKVALFSDGWYRLFWCGKLVTSNPMDFEQACNYCLAEFGVDPSANE